MMGKHDVVIADAGAEWKAAHVVSIELVEGFDLNEEFEGLESRKLTGDVRKRRVGIDFVLADLAPF